MRVLACLVRGFVLAVRDARAACAVRAACAARTVHVGCAARSAHAALAVLMAAMAVMCVIAGCRTVPTAPVEATEVACPADFQTQLHLTASSVPWMIPADLASGDGLNAVLGRRVLVSIAPRAAASEMHIVSSEVAISPFGGTFRGWAQFSPPSAGEDGPETARSGDEAAQRTREPARRGHEAAATAAIEVSPGRLLITPFLHTTQLRPLTLSLDVIMSPGAEPLDEMVISAGAQWDARLRPLPPERIGLSLELLRHYTVYDQVDGIVSSTFVLAPAAHSSSTTTCTAETRVNLVDRASSTPPLWDLRQAAPAGRSEWWLALFDPQTGAHRVIFKDSAAANGFSSWLRQTRALRIGQYQLGVFRPNYSSEARRTIPQLHSVTDTFRAATPEDFDALVVGRLGER